MQINKFLTSLLVVLLSIISINASAKAGNSVQIIPAYNMQDYACDIQNLYATVPGSHSRNLHERIISDSAYFLNKPYLNGALGEGPNGKFDQSPLYRTDAFDCLTYVSTVLALVKANNLSEFEQIIKKVNYQNGIVAFKTRNHFTQNDWNRSNAKNGYIEDITEQLRDQAGKSVALISCTLIDKSNWYAKLSERIKLLHAVSFRQGLALEQSLRAQGRAMHSEASLVAYIPLTVLFDENKQANMFLFKQIPNASIIEIVRPNWDLTEAIGTHLDISHLGLVINTPQGLMFRNASSLQGKVADVPLVDYLSHYLDSPTIKGINIQRIK